MYIIGVAITERFLTINSMTNWVQLNENHKDSNFKLNHLYSR